MESEADRLAARLEVFGLNVIKFVRSLRRDPACDGLARQLARSGPGVASNYRSARRARSRREFVSRLAVALDEADESELWLSLISAKIELDSQILKSSNPQILKFLNR
jgi:four helix bundle protein